MQEGSNANRSDCPKEALGNLMVKSSGEFCCIGRRVLNTRNADSRGGRVGMRQKWGGKRGTTAVVMRHLLIGLKKLRKDPYTASIVMLGLLGASALCSEPGWIGAASTESSQ